MKFEGTGHRLGSKPSSELWTIRTHNKYVFGSKRSDFKSEISERQSRLDKTFDITISKIVMPVKLPPIKFESKSTALHSPKYINKSISRNKQPTAMAKSVPIRNSPVEKSRSTHSLKIPKRIQVSKLNEPPHQEMPVVIYESSSQNAIDQQGSNQLDDSLNAEMEVDDVLKNNFSLESIDRKSLLDDEAVRLVRTCNITDSKSSKLAEKSLQVAQRLKIIESHSYKEEFERRKDLISQRIDKSVPSRPNFSRFKTLKSIASSKPISPSNNDCNNDKVKPEEIIEKSITETAPGPKFWRPPDIDNDCDNLDDDSLVKEYLEYSFHLALPGSKSTHLSVKGDVPLTNITTFLQRCMSTTPESSLTSNQDMDGIAFTISNDVMTTTDDLGPWNTKLLSDLGLLNSEIKVLTPDT